MLDTQPLLLREATLALYPADASGNPVTAAPIWCGVAANGLRLGLAFDEALSFSSGDRYRTAHHEDERHEIEIARTWVIRKTDPGELFGPQRGGRYVLEIVWYSDRTRYWHRRLYYGVTGRGADLVSDGPRQHNQPQVYRAEYFTQSGGQDDPGVFTPIANTADEQLVGFFGEDPLLVDAYLLGHYCWSAARRLTGWRYAGWSPQADTTLTLELDGVLTATTVVIPAGAANTDATASGSLDVSVAAGAAVRWRVTAGPEAADAAWHFALVLASVAG